MKLKEFRELTQRLDQNTEIHFCDRSGKTTKILIVDSEDIYLNENKLERFIFFTEEEMAGKQKCLVLLG